MELKEEFEKNLTGYLENRIILDKRYLDDEQLGPTEKASILRVLYSHKIRENEFSKLNQHFAPLFAGNQPYNLCIYGKPGTGKTVTARVFLGVLSELCDQRNISYKIVSLHLGTPKTPFQFLNDLACELNVSKKYRKGVAHDEFMNKIVDVLKNFTGYLIILVDEINNIKSDPDPVFQFLVRRLPTEINSKLILILISNKLDWTDGLDPRVKSFFKKEDIYFRPYNALDLQTILRLRVEKALNTSLVESGVVEKIAAWCSRDHGDARKAVALLAKASQIAEDRHTPVTLDCIDDAESSIEIDRYLEAADTFPKQYQVAFLSIVHGYDKQRKDKITTGEGYEIYVKIAQQYHLRPLTQRRYSECLRELDMTGFINMRVVSKGRYGRTAEISLAVSNDMIADKVCERIINSLEGR
jgi:cell division control protein 6